MNRSMLYALSLAALTLTGSNASAQDGRYGRRPMANFRIDPACLATVPWFVDPAAEDMKLNNCRPIKQMAAPDAQGWVRYDTQDGAVIEVNRAVEWNPRNRRVAFKVRYNGGGSLTSVYTVAGGPVMAGTLKAGTFTVK